MQIFPIGQIPESLYKNIGGKARGLDILARHGFDIPHGILIYQASINIQNDEIIKAYKQLNFKEVAVRSSANNEDGDDYSFAGQYATILNVKNENELSNAVNTCVDSLKNKTAAAYSQNLNNNNSTFMNIVIQEMVDPIYSGVCFSINPINNQNEIFIELVKGIGEKLVSGEQKGIGYTVNKTNFELITKTDDQNLTSDLKGLAKSIMEITKIMNEEIDSEWAVTADHKIKWLQARPITTVSNIAIDEFDTKIYNPDTVFTTCNIGEMLPGAVTPLSLSVTVKGIDEGLRIMLLKSGAYKKKELDKLSCITNFNNTLFFNLTTIYKLATAVAGAKKDDVEISICSKRLNTPPLPWKNKPTPVRLLNSVRYFSFLFSFKKAIKKINQLIKNYRIESSADPKIFYKNITNYIPHYYLGTYCHYVTSSHSGAMGGALLRVCQDSFKDELDARSAIAGVLQNIPNIESADILKSMKDLAVAITNDNPEAAKYSPEKLIDYLEHANKNVSDKYQYFLQRHGHRAIREAELRSMPWKDNKISFAENLATVMNSANLHSEERKVDIEAYKKQMIGNKTGSQVKAIEFLIKQTRNSVYNREYTKSGFIRLIDNLKIAYRSLADILVQNKLLPDADLIYFLTHQELGDLINNNKVSLIKKAILRKRLLPEQFECQYDDVYIGKPSPKPKYVDDHNINSLSGDPISRGIIKGTARVINSPEDAKTLKEGEIMVVKFTDIGWSPYYSIAGGMITEIGSALSHGAVVAREYGLPLVVNVKNATNIIKTGDTIHLNATSGLIDIIKNN